MCRIFKEAFLLRVRVPLELEQHEKCASGSLNWGEARRGWSPDCFSWSLEQLGPGQAALFLVENHGKRAGIGGSWRAWYHLGGELEPAVLAPKHPLVLLQALRVD